MGLGRMKALWLFLSICFFYTLWMTGFTFVFSECETLPNYTMLAKGFVKGQLFIQESPLGDTILKDGKRYLYSGPVPALLRTPFLFVFGWGLPTGALIIIYCSGICTLLALILDELTPAGKSKSLAPVKTILLITFVINGFSLYMVAMPTFFNEAISAAMFFLMASILLLLKVRRKGYRATGIDSMLIACTLSLSVGSRLSYAFAVVVIGGVLIAGLIKNFDKIPPREIIRNVLIVSGVGIVAACLLLWYNYTRFGSFFDFGLDFFLSLYRDYFIRYGFFRYDHFPYNIWSLFFRPPQFVADFPFLFLPRYILQVKSIGLTPYFLMNTNELSVSIFYLMPIMMISLVPLFAKRFETGINFGDYSIIFFIFGIQVVVISLTVASTVRYYYDFLAPMMMMTYIGAMCLQTTGRVSHGMIGLLGTISIVISFAVPMNAIEFYAQFIGYTSPLLNIFF